MESHYHRLPGETVVVDFRYHRLPGETVVVEYVYHHLPGEMVVVLGTFRAKRNTVMHDEKYVA